MSDISGETSENINPVVPATEKTTQQPTDYLTKKGISSIQGPTPAEVIASGGPKTIDHRKLFIKHPSASLSEAPITPHTNPSAPSINELSQHVTPVPTPSNERIAKAIETQVKIDSVVNKSEQTKSQ